MSRVTPGRRALPWAALAAWMGVIFLLSAQPAEDSAALSGLVAQAVAALLDRLERLFGAEGLPEGVLGVLQVLVRKAAHFVAYAVLGALALTALAPRPGEGAARAGSGVVGSGLALLLSAAYAVTDEAHQTLVPGRAGQATDVLLDSAGALVGILLLRWWWGRAGGGATPPPARLPDPTPGTG